ncbi:MAG TPA: RES family NAD+ phosphorylase, partial [Flavobacteriales bacterium]|nr:RES family NAD+ phosphorylase [Flavobacteriales bacterium]
MILYRIERREHAHKLDGAGAAKAGARWNSKGTCVIYCGEHEATTVLEVLAHVGEMPDDRVLITYELPDDVSMLKPELMPALPQAERDA